MRNFLRRAEGRASSRFSLFIYELLWPVGVTSSRAWWGIWGGFLGTGAGSTDFGPWTNQVKSSVRKVKTPLASVCFCACVCVVCVCGIWCMGVWWMVCGFMAAVCLVVYFSFFGDPISSGPLFIYCRTATAAAAPSSCCHNKKAQPQSEIYINIQVYTIYTHNNC